MDRHEIERIARVVVKDYGLPLKLDGISMAHTGQCTVGFADSYSGASVSVGIWCDAKVSPHGVRESLKRGLQVAD